MSPSQAQFPVILFDGVCEFCASSVQFIVKRDPSGKFKFAPLQSETGRKLVLQLSLEDKNIDSLILIEEGEYYIKSTAVLRIARGLNALWPVLYVFIIIPKPLRDYFYDIVARNRYKWFGKKEECMVPDPEIKKRFLT